MVVAQTDLRSRIDDRGNRFEVGGNLRFEKSRVFANGAGARVVVGNDVFFYDCEIRVGDGSTLIVGDGCTIGGRISIGLNSSIRIGTGTSVTKRIALQAVEGTSIDIGDDCMIASEVTIRTNDGHVIRDARTRERVNHSKSITIGPHVWLCDGALVLKGASIGQASVIAACSVVTGPVDPNSIYAGAPAKKVRGGITWERDNRTVSEPYYLPSETP